MTTGEVKGKLEHINEGNHMDSSALNCKDLMKVIVQMIAGAFLHSYFYIAQGLSIMFELVGLFMAKWTPKSIPVWITEWEYDNYTVCRYSHFLHSS